LTTDKKLVAAAAALLDAGGESAVTLRAVGHAVGVSHNAPYKHFKDRGALLAAVAIADFEILTDEFVAIRNSDDGPLRKFKRALDVFIIYGHKYPARYRLLFSDPDIAAQGGHLEQAALKTFFEFAGIVAACQTSRDLPATPNAELTGLVFATLHGLIDLESGGRMRQEKGLSSPSESMQLLTNLLEQSVKSF
jgi:AcrR family transcriptional regulator